MARAADGAHAMCDVSDELVADLGHSCDASGVSVVIDVTALPLSRPASTIIAEDPDLVPRLAGVGDDYELVFRSPTDASPAIECLSPELTLPITATGAIERKAGVRLVDAAPKRVPKPPPAGSTSDADRHPAHRVDARRLPGAVDDRRQHCRADRRNRR